MKKEKAFFHLPGLFEFYELYSMFLPLFREHREYFYDWCEIGSIYGAPMGCLWGGGRVSTATVSAEQVLSLVREYGISARLTFSNSLLEGQHLGDKKCNELCALFEHGVSGNGERGILGNCEQNISRSCVQNGVIVHSELLLEHIRRHYPGLYLVSSTTKVLTEVEELIAEARREEFKYVVPDFRLNRRLAELAEIHEGIDGELPEALREGISEGNEKNLSSEIRDKLEFLCNECCYFGCSERRRCYEDVSLKNLGVDGEEHICRAPHGNKGYRFSDAMKNPGFISRDDIVDTYLPLGFSNFKIEGRGLGSALVLEFLLYYLTKPEYQLKVREEIYLDSMLDLF